MRAEKDFNITIKEIGWDEDFKIFESWLSHKQAPKNYEYDPVGLRLLGFSNISLNKDETFNATIKGVRYLGIKLNSIENKDISEDDNIIVNVNFEYTIALM